MMTAVIDADELLRLYPPYWIRHWIWHVAAVRGTPTLHAYMPQFYACMCVYMCVNKKIHYHARWQGGKLKMRKQSK